jgi:glycosyltransferase involved in cell wall biosynthesis
MQPQITVIVPVYNGSRYLAELLETVCAQTYSAWTCLCVNDGSTDDSEVIIRDFMSRDPRFQLITKINGGTGSARNVGLANVKTPYIMFADQDDWLHPQCFEVALTLIEASQADILTFERTRVYYGKFKPAVIDVRSLEVRPVSIVHPEQFILGGGQYSCFVWQRIFKTAAVIGIFLPEISGGEDIVFMYELAYQVKTWAYCDVVLYAIRENQESTSRTVSSSYVANFLTAIKALSSAMQKHRVPDQKRKSLLLQSVVGFLQVCIMIGGRGRSSRTLFADLSKLLAAVDIEVFSDIKRSIHQVILLELLRKKRYAMLKSISWICLPYFERYRLLAMIRHAGSFKGE